MASTARLLQPLAHKIQSSKWLMGYLKGQTFAHHFFEVAAVVSDWALERTTIS
jgi:hypothetical protein